MSESDHPLEKADALRRQAEERVQQQACQAAGGVCPGGARDNSRVLHELRVHQIELEMQNEELRRAQVELEAARVRYFDLYDLAPVGYCTLSERGLILEANLTAAALLGVPRGALVQQPLSAFIFREDQDLYYRHRKRLFATLARQTCELRMVKKDGTLFWGRIEASIVTDPEGHPVCRLVLSDITERVRAEQALRETAERLALATRVGGVGIWDYDVVGNRMIWDDQMLRLYGLTQEQFGATYEAWRACVHPDDRPRSDEEMQQALRGEKEFDTEFRVCWPDGRTHDIRAIGTVQRDSTGKVVRMVGTNWDITAQKQAVAEKVRLQGQLVQAQKLESVGRLAGGVAHDFNNLLMGIMGYADLCLEGLPEGHALRGHLDEINRISQRSADLTRQLLAFARKQVLVPKVLDLNNAVTGMCNLLQRMIGESIKLTWNAGAGLWPVKLDPSQVDQVLVNLCLNARDAIAEVGNVTIETANVTLTLADCAAHAGWVPGAYVRLTVHDDGRGMSPDILANIFEPFYTTKGFGAGTGLGLATVYGIVTQSKGFIDVESAPGQGTTFRLFLPRFEGEVAAVPAVGSAEVPRGRGETILLVEDEQALRATCGPFLVSRGYRVLVAGCPDEALALAAQQAGALQLLLTDVILPGMNGRVLAERLRASQPNLKVLFMSGYTADVIAEQGGVLTEELHFLQKPFSREVLARKVHEVLGAPAP